MSALHASVRIAKPPTNRRPIHRASRPQPGGGQTLRKSPAALGSTARSVIRKFLTAIVAPGGSGKSSLVIAELLEMVSGKPLLTGRNAKPLRVWYLNIEDPRDEIDRRIAAACIAYKLDPD